MGQSMRMRLTIAAVFLVGLLGVAAWNLAPTYRHLIKTEEIQVDPNLRVFLGGGGNSLVLRSDDGLDVLLVDTKMPPAATRLRDYIYGSGLKPHLTVVNTHYHSDHTGGNSLFPDATLLAGDYPDDMWNSEVKGRLPTERLRPDTEKVIRIGDETVHLRAVGQAHTVADVVVYLEKRRLLMTGDLVFVEWNPVLRRDSGADMEKWMRALDRLRAEYVIDVLVPGHGPMTQARAMEEQRDYFAAILAAGSDAEKISSLRKKYSAYYSLPFLSGFDRSVAYAQGR